MTVQEARQHMGLKDNDTIYEEGIRDYMKSRQEHLKIWSLTSHMKAEIKADIEACRVLLKEVKA